MVVSTSHSLAIFRASQLVPQNSVIAAETHKKAAGLIGPLILADAATAIKYIDDQSASNEDLLWSLMSIAARTKGKLRIDSVDDAAYNLPSEILDLLLKADEKSNGELDQEPLYKDRPDALGSLQLAQELLLKGQHEEAAREAAKQGHFALSLVISHRCGLKTFEQAIADFGRDGLVEGCPLQAVTMMLSNQISEVAEIHWGDDTNRLRLSWKKILAAIISNRSPSHRWDFFASSLGDRLLAAGDITAAHFCYLTCGSSLASPGRKGCKLTLIGVDVEPTDLLIMTDLSIAALARTEAYEWAKRHGNPSAMIDHLQPLKLQYAMLLVEYGYEEAALSYARSIALCIGANDAELDSPRSQVPLWAAPFIFDREHLIGVLSSSMKRLERRIAPYCLSPTTKDGNASRASSEEPSPMLKPPLAPPKQSLRAEAGQAVETASLPQLQSKPFTEERIRSSNLPPSQQFQSPMQQQPPFLAEPKVETRTPMQIEATIMDQDASVPPVSQMKAVESAPVLHLQQTTFSTLAPNKIETQTIATGPPSAPSQHPTTPTGQAISSTTQQGASKPQRSAPMSAPAHLEGRSEYQTQGLYRIRFLSRVD